MAEKEAADRLPVDWDDVILKSKNVGASLAIVKRKFTLVSGNTLVMLMNIQRLELHGLTISNCRGQSRQRGLVLMVVFCRMRQEQRLDFRT